jgi:DNA repair exonuclease SbcCD ATPase subunit
LKAESDSLRSQLQSKTESARGLESKYAQLEKAHSSVQEQLTSVISEKEALEKAKVADTARAGNTQKTLAELQEKLIQAATELATNSKKLHNVENELKRATRRAEEAEKIQSDLQNEGTNLMRSLNEMRPKIVELTNIRVEMIERIDELEGIIRKKEDAISQLEASLDDAKERESHSAKSRQREELARKKDESSSQQNLLHVQKAYADLEVEVEALKASLKDREAEREGYHQLALRRLEEVDRLTFSLQAQTELLSTAERELEERRAASSEDRGFVEGMQNEIELLQAEIAQKDEEVERLRDSLPPLDATNSLDGEMSSALKQQQMLELSGARSQIRALESAVFEADARAHSLQKQVSSLMDQLTQLRSLSSVPTRPFSPTPGMPSRPGSRARNVSDELRAQVVRVGSSQSVSGMSNPRSSPSHKPRKSTFETLSPETKHKRRVSLGMLKARIDGELASSGKSSRPPSRALTPLPESEMTKANGASSSSSVMEPSEPHHIRGFKRHQFLDESHVFWCQSCHGDLVIL